MARVVRLEEFRLQGRKASGVVYFTRCELEQLLSLYSRRVASDEWRDYAIDHGAGCAFFSVFRHSFDRPLFSVAKRRRAGDRDTEFLLLAGYRQLKSGRDLAVLLKQFERNFRVVS